MVRIMNELTQLSSEDIYVYSNCDEVRLYVNRESSRGAETRKILWTFATSAFYFLEIRLISCR